MLEHPSLIVLAAWFQVDRDFSSEGELGRQWRDAWCTKHWCMKVLIGAGATAESARNWVERNWQ